MSVTVIVEFEALPGKGSVLKQALQMGVEHLRANPDCVGVELYEELAEDGFVYVQAWTSAGVHREYQKRLTADGAMASLSGLLVSPPRTTYYTQL